MHSDPKFSEKELAERARRGDIPAFEELIRSHETKAFSFALNIVGGQRELAQDIMQEAFFNAYRGISSFRGDGLFSSWLWQILKNSYLRYLERSDAPREIPMERPEGLSEEQEPATEETFSRAEGFMHLRNLVSRLHIDEQEVLTLVEFQELSLEETAVLLGISVRAVKSRLHRARQRFVSLVKRNKNLFL